MECGDIYRATQSRCEERPVPDEPTVEDLFLAAAKTSEVDDYGLDDSGPVVAVNDLSAYLFLVGQCLDLLGEDFDLFEILVNPFTYGHDV